MGEEADRGSGEEERREEGKGKWGRMTRRRRGICKRPEEDSSACPRRQDTAESSVVRVLGLNVGANVVVLRIFRPCLGLTTAKRTGTRVPRWPSPRRSEN